MGLWDTLVDFWWIPLIGLPLYLLYIKSKQGGVSRFSTEELRMFLFYGVIMFVIFLCQKYLFAGHFYLMYNIIIMLPVLIIFIHLIKIKDSVFIIENTMDCEIFYDIGELEKRIAHGTRCRAFIMDRSAYNEIEHQGEIDYPYWDGGDNVKFTDFFDQNRGIMYHPTISHLHNVSFFMAKSFWVKMKLDLPDLIRQNVMLTWLAPYKTAYEQSKLAKNFKLRLASIEKQYEDQPFKLPDEIRDIWEDELEKKRQDREASEVKVPIESTPTESTPVNNEGDES